MIQCLLFWLMTFCVLFPFVTSPDPDPLVSASVFSLLLSLDSASASFGGAFEGQLRPSAVRRLAQSKASSRCSFFFLFLEDEPLRSFMASHIPRFLAHPKKKKERAKMATSRGVDRHFRGPGRQKSWRYGKTSGDTTRKCSKGQTVTFNNGWRG